MKANSLIAAVALCLAGSTPTLKASFMETFQDGDTTANPAWTVTNPPIGSDSVVLDPFRQDSRNYVLEMTGTYTAHRRLATTAINVPARGFRFEVEYAVSADAPDFNLILELGSSDGSFSIRDRLLGDTQYGGGSHWWIAKNPGGSAEWVVQDPSPAFFLDEPYGQWWDLILWNDPGTPVINGEIRRVADGSLIYQRSYILDSIPSGTINVGSIDIEGLSPQYVDNFQVSTVPLPGSILLGVWAVGLAGWRLRRHEKMASRR